MIDVDDSNIEGNNTTQIQWHWLIGEVAELDDHHAVISEWRWDEQSGNNAAVLDALHHE